jgi:Uma2 family endonuclease
MLEPSEFSSVELRPVRRAEYERMGELGFFEDEKVELLGGVIVKMSPIGPLHIDLESLLVELIVKSLPPHLIVRPNGPIALSDISEPEPDLAVVPRKKLGEPHPSNALLMIEISDSSLSKDRGIKARLYAEAGVPDYWIVDVKAMAIEVYREPKGNRYTRIVRYDQSASVTALLVPEITVCLADLAS